MPQRPCDVTVSIFSAGSLCWIIFCDLQLLAQRYKNINRTNIYSPCLTFHGIHLVLFCYQIIIFRNKYIMVSWVHRAICNTWYEFNDHLSIIMAALEFRHLCGCPCASEVTSKDMDKTIRKPCNCRRYCGAISPTYSQYHNRLLPGQCILRYIY